MYKFFCRTYQFVMKFASRLLPWTKPNLIRGPNSILMLPDEIMILGCKKILIVTDKTIVSLGLMDEFLKLLKEKAIEFMIYDNTSQNPTIDNIEEAYAVYTSSNCDGIVGFGGGSPIDCAKGVGARVARPNMKVSQMKGLFKIRKKIPPFFAVPTTAGTGSEGTLAAVITDSKTHEKYPINDLNLIPKYAVLDPNLTIGLPKSITATTGMDALTHAVEAYIGNSNTKETIELSEKAIKLIFDNIKTAFNDGENITARENMLLASHYAGLAFTRAYVGYVHAIAHTLGGFYNIPHGHANAVILPYVLDYFGSSVYEKLSDLTKIINVFDSSKSSEENAKEFISQIRKLNNYLEIPNKIQGIDDKDIPLMISRALSEANPLYPVPMILGERDLRVLYMQIMGKAQDNTVN